MIRAGAFVVFVASSALAHDGFENLTQRGAHCCGGRDCRYIPDAWITPNRAAGGYRVTVPAGEWPDKFPIAHFPGGTVMQWQGEPDFSPDGTTIACVTSQMGGRMTAPEGGGSYLVAPSGRLLCLYVGAAY